MFSTDMMACSAVPLDGFGSHTGTGQIGVTDVSNTCYRFSLHRLDSYPPLHTRHPSPQDLQAIVTMERQAGRAVRFLPGMFRRRQCEQDRVQRSVSSEVEHGDEV